MHVLPLCAKLRHSSGSRQRETKRKGAHTRPGRGGGASRQAHYVPLLWAASLTVNPKRSHKEKAYSTQQLSKFVKEYKTLLASGEQG